MTQEKIVSQLDAEADGLKIIGAGFGRTGTRSLKEALEILGFGPCYHMIEVIEHPEYATLWEAASKGELAGWSEIFRGYQSTVDWPGCTFYKQLMSEYPDAKVLLSVRDPESWYESVKSTIYQSIHRAVVNPITAARISMLKGIIWDGTFQNRFEEREYATSIFKRHNEEVKRYVPAEKLLVYEVKEGWAPLCAFLGVSVPDVPFPRLNDRESFPGNRLG